MRLSSVGMSQHAADTHHDQCCVHQHDTPGDGNAKRGPAEAFHVRVMFATRCRIPIRDNDSYGLVQELSPAVYLQVLTHATDVKSPSIEPFGYLRISPTTQVIATASPTTNAFVVISILHPWVPSPFTPATAPGTRWQHPAPACSPVATLGACLHDRRGEGPEVVQLLGDDRMHDIQVQAGVFMHSHVAKADHSLHAAGQIGRQDTACL